MSVITCIYTHMCVCVCVFMCVRMCARRHSLSVSPRAGKCDPPLQMQLCLRGSHLISAEMCDVPEVMCESGKAGGSFSVRSVLH